MRLSVLLTSPVSVTYLLTINPAKVQDFYRVEGNLEGNPANIQEFYAFSVKMGSSAHKSCINAAFFNNGNKTGKNDVFLQAVEKPLNISTSFRQL